MAAMQSKSLFTLLSFFISSVYGHGYITSPAARVAGDQLSALCGDQVFNNQAADTYGNIQGELQLVGSNFDASKCNLWQCKGFQFADQPASNIQSYTAGEVVPIHFEIRAPHDGVANISIVDTATNSVLSELKSWDQYALTSRPLQADEQDFEITIPSDLGSQCSTAGACVIQMYWDARSVDQTYESCIDFTVGDSGSGNGGGNSPSSSSAASVAITSTASNPNNVATTTPTSVASITSSVAGTSAASDIVTLTAGATTLLCREEL